jgi:hypothetical protein
VWKSPVAGATAIFETGWRVIWEAAWGSVLLAGSVPLPSYDLILNTRRTQCQEESEGERCPDFDPGTSVTSVGSCVLSVLKALNTKDTEENTERTEIPRRSWTLPVGGQRRHLPHPAFPRKRESTRGAHDLKDFPNGFPLSRE